MPTSNRLVIKDNKAGGPIPQLLRRNRVVLHACAHACMVEHVNVPCLHAPQALSLPSSPTHQRKCFEGHIWWWRWIPSPHRRSDCLFCLLSLFWLFCLACSGQNPFFLIYFNYVPLFLSGAGLFQVPSKVQEQKKLDYCPTTLIKCADKKEKRPRYLNQHPACSGC